MNKNLTQVLWVEDDPLITRTYPIEASEYHIELVPFSCWEDAEKALTSEFKRWDAIILDAKCKYKRDDHDNAQRFLANAINAIGTICSKRNRIIPWYVLSGGSEEELNDLIIESRKEWDGDWKDKNYYSKTTDRKILFERIPHHVRKSPEMQIRCVDYPDVFNAIKEADLDVEVANYMEDLLVPIHYHGYTGKDYNDNMTKVRKCIELIFQSMAEKGILPNQKKDNKYTLHKRLVDKRGGINNTRCSKILSGIPITSNNRSDGELLISSENILPNVLKESFQRLIEISASYEHAENKDADEEKQANSRHTSEFLNSINNAPYLLRSMAMDLCNIILWYASYIEEHEDEEINALEWKIYKEE